MTENPEELYSIEAIEPNLLNHIQEYYQQQIRDAKYLDNSELIVVYECPHCGWSMAAVIRDPGPTPVMIPCDRCKKYAGRDDYDPAINLWSYIGKIDYLFYRPLTESECLETQDEIKRAQAQLAQQIVEGEDPGLENPPDEALDDLNEETLLIMPGAHQMPKYILTGGLKLKPYEEI